MRTDYTNKIITLPNLLSALRIALIPILAVTFLDNRPYLTALILLLSGLTDIADGFIARRYNMTSNLGKVLDPIADKLTVGVIFICMINKFPTTALLLALLIFKEVLVGFTGLLVVKYCSKVFGAQWHGKIAGFSMYSLIFIHLLWQDIPADATAVSVFICSCVMILSLILYLIRNLSELFAQSRRSRRQG